MTTYLEDLKARVLLDVAATPSPTRAVARSQTRAVVYASLAASGFAFFALDGVRHGGGRPSALVLVACLVWCGVAIAALGTVLGARPLGPRRVVLLAVAVGTPAMLLVTMVALGLAWPETLAVHAERVGLKCLGLTLLTAALPLAGLMAVRRGTAARHARAAGAALGAGCGAAAGVMVVLWCPVMVPRHVLVGHIAPVVALVVVGMALGERVLAMRDLKPGARTFLCRSRP
jgi:hypothetical protein